MTMKVLEGCFTPDKNGYQLVIYNSQPFNDKYLDFLAVLKNLPLWSKTQILFTLSAI